MSADCLIIGGGAVGLTSALALLQRGYTVTLLERGTVGKEASWAGGGILSPLCSWDYRECVTRLSQRGMGMFEAAAAELYAETGVDTEYQRSGMLVLPDYPEATAIDWCNRHHVPQQSLELKNYFPWMSGSGLLLPDIAQVRNPRLLLALRTRVTQLGGKILEQHAVQRFERSHNQVVALQTTQGKITADNYIVTAGTWSKTLLGEHAMSLDIRPIRGQMLLLKFDAPPFAHILLKNGLYLIPRRDGHLLIGSTLEDVGFDKTPTDVARDHLFQRALQLFPQWQNQPIVQHWAGLRPSTVDNIPTIGRHPQLGNLYANAGHFRYGVTMSLASAEVLANEIAGKTQTIQTTEYTWQ